MLFRYCCPLKSLNVLRIIANKQTNKQSFDGQAKLNDALDLPGYLT